MSNKEEVISKCKQLNELIALTGDVDELVRKYRYSLNDDKRGARAIVAVGLKQSGKAILLNVLAKCFNESDFIFNTSEEVSEITVLKKDDLILADTPPLDGEQQIADKCLKDVDVCILVHDVHREIEECELEFLKRYKNRPHGEYYPFIIVLNNLNGLDKQAVDEKCRSVSETVRKALRLKKSELNLSLSPYNTDVIPFYGTEFLDEIAQIDVTTQAALFSPKELFQMYLEVRGDEANLDKSIYEGFLQKHQAIIQLLKQLYGSRVSIDLKKIHTALSFLDKFESYKKELVPEHLTNLINESIEELRAFKKEVESYGEEFERRYREILSAQSKRKSENDSDSEILELFDDLVNFVSENCDLYTINERLDDYSFQDSLLNTFDEEKLRPLYENYSKVVPESSLIVVDEGPSISYRRAVGIVSENMGEDFFDEDDDYFDPYEEDYGSFFEDGIIRQYNDIVEETNLIIDSIATTIFMQQVILGCDIDINQELRDLIYYAHWVAVGLRDNDLFDESELEKYNKEIKNFVNKQKKEFEASSKDLASTSN